MAQDHQETRWQKYGFVFTEPYVPIKKAGIIGYGNKKSKSVYLNLDTLERELPSPRNIMAYSGLGSPRSKVRSFIETAL